MADARPVNVGRYSRTAERRTQVVHARQLVAVADGDRGLLAAGLAELVRRPGGSHGRRYVAGGGNRLGETVPAYRVPMVAANHPLTVTPSYAYAVLDVDYDRAPSDAARAHMRDQVDELVALVRPCGVPAVRIPSGGAQNGWANEHVWLVTGHHTLRLDNRQRLAALLAGRWPDLSIVGGLIDGSATAQQVRPPGSRHRSDRWPALERPVEIVETLAGRGPPADGWALLLDRLARSPGASAASADRQPRKPSRRRAPDGWADRLLEHGPDPGSDRSVEGCRLIGHLLSRGWDVERITSRLVDSPAVDYLRDRLGRVELETRVRDDVVRIAGKHRRGGTRRPVAEPVAAVAAHWDLIELPDGTRPRWLTQSGRAVLGALAAEAARTGHLTVGASQRTVAIASGVSARTVGRTYRRWAAYGALRLDLDDGLHVAAVTIEPDSLERLLPSDLTATPLVHTPGLEGRALHDAWAQRPAGSPPGVGLLGVTARRVWLRLLRAGALSAAGLACELGWGRVYARRVLGRLEGHGLVWEGPDRRWEAASGPAIGALLAVAAVRLGTAGVLARRRARYETEQAQWARPDRPYAKDRREPRRVDEQAIGQLALWTVPPDEGSVGIRGPTASSRPERVSRRCPSTVRARSHR